MEERPAHYAAAVGASLIAEAVFLGMVALMAVLRGTDPWRIFRMPAAFFAGASAVEPPGFVPHDVVLGLAIHVALGALVGVLYAQLLSRLRVGAITAGLITGAILYVLGFWLLPQVFRDQLAPFWLSPSGRALQALAHVVYGVMFGITFRWLAPTRERQRHA